MSINTRRKTIKNLKFDEKNHMQKWQEFDLRDRLKPLNMDLAFQRLE